MRRRRGRYRPPTLAMCRGDPIRCFVCRFHVRPDSGQQRNGERRGPHHTAWSLLGGAGWTKRHNQIRARQAYPNSDGSMRAGPFQIQENTVRSMRLYRSAVEQSSPPDRESPLPGHCRRPQKLTNRLLPREFRGAGRGSTPGTLRESGVPEGARPDRFRSRQAVLRRCQSAGIPNLPNPVTVVANLRERAVDSRVAGCRYR